LDCPISDSGLEWNLIGKERVRMVLEIAEFFGNPCSLVVAEF
jgi:hypothetical protein